MCVHIFVGVCPHLCRWVHIFVGGPTSLLLLKTLNGCPLGVRPPLQNSSAFLTRNSGLNMNVRIKIGGRKLTVLGSAGQTKRHYTKRLQRTKDACEQLHVLGGQPRVLLEGAPRILGVGRGI